jgi:hypothetical protein
MPDLLSGQKPPSLPESMPTKTNRQMRAAYHCRVVGQAVIKRHNTAGSDLKPAMIFVTITVGPDNQPIVIW